MAEIAKGKIGAEGAYDVKIQDGKVRVEIGYDGAGVDAGVFVHLEPEYFVSKLAEAIPGKVDDMIFASLLAMLKGA